MSLVTAANDATPQRLRADTLAQSLVVLLVVTIAQRGIGLVRGVLVCRWLDAEHLGEWDLAFGFLTLAAPAAALGLMASFGRYLEYYRQRGQARAFLRRTAAAVTLLSTLAVVWLVVDQDRFAHLIFGGEGRGDLVVLLAVSLAPLIAFYYCTESFSGLRLFRVVSALQFLHSLSFAVLSIVLVRTCRADAYSLVVAYAASNTVCAAAAFAWLMHTWRVLPHDTQHLPHRALWCKILPFSLWLWVGNWLANLFEVADRYMLVHFSQMPTSLALQAVGNYHSARIVPLLLLSVAGLLGTTLLPHLSHDWEAGRRQAVALRMRLTLKLLAAALLAGSCVVLVLAPLLFDWAFQGKYNGGLDILPWTLVYMGWTSLIYVASPYLWCAERARLPSLALLVGLGINLLLNLLLVPRFGLPGAVWATAAANAVALAVLYLLAARFGLLMDTGLLVLSLAPLALGVGLYAALAAVVVLLHQAATRNWLLRPQEKQVLRDWIHAVLCRLGISRPVI
jgi:PST family polysaccharide transporter